jgi:polyphosphate kinase 2 (PPK2 family)
MPFAEGRHSLLICLQAMGTGGKDWTVNHVLAAMNPQGWRVAKLRQPSVTDTAQDFLWGIEIGSRPKDVAPNKAWGDLT